MSSREPSGLRMYDGDTYVGGARAAGGRRDVDVRASTYLNGVGGSIRQSSLQEARLSLASCSALAAHIFVIKAAIHYR